MQIFATTTLESDGRGGLGESNRRGIGESNRRGRRESNKREGDRAEKVYRVSVCTLMNYIAN